MLSIFQNLQRSFLMGLFFLILESENLEEVIARRMENTAVIGTKKKTFVDEGGNKGAQIILFRDMPGQ